MVRVTFTGTPAEVDAKVAGYMVSYHPAGYGTRETGRVINADGTVTATVSRGSSCD